MQNPKESNLTLNLLVLASLIGLVLTGWLVGHILRFSNSELWHPPVEEIDPQIKNGFKLEDQRVVVPSNDPWVRIYVDGALPSQALEFDLCLGDIYYTSQPAKCRSLGGSLVQVGGSQMGNIAITPNK